MPSRRRAVFLAAMGLIVASCAKLADLPEGALISCESAADCPSGRICHQSRCESPGSIDATPPDFAAPAAGHANPEVSPTVGRAGTTFTIEVTPTEPLAAPPEVVLALLPPLTAPCAASGARYRCIYSATGAERRSADPAAAYGGVVPFDVTLVDRGGNVTRRNAAGALNLDFTAPVAAAASVEPASARLGSVLQVFVTASEELSTGPVLVASQGLDTGAGLETRFAMVRQPGTLNWTFAHLVTGSDPQGDVTFAVELTDLAGNVATGVAIGGARIDRDPPVVSNLTAGPGRVNAAGTVTATFDVSDATALTVTVGGRAMSCGARQATSPQFTCTFPMRGDEIPADSEAPQSLVVEASDEAGNLTTEGRSVTFDFRPPRLALATVNYLPAADNPLATVSAATAGTRIRVLVAADEALRGVPVLSATLGGTTLDFAPVEGSNTATGATLEALVPPGAADGSYVATVTLIDLAGNRAEPALSGPQLQVKTSPPTLSVIQDAIVFVRSPWGNAREEDLGAYRIPAGPYFGIEPSDPLSPAARLPAGTFLLDGGEVPAALLVQLGPEVSSLRLGTLFPDVAGTWPRQPLATPDTPTVWLFGVDRAGNRSSAVRVRDAEWVATSNASASALHRLSRLPAACPSLSGCPDATVAVTADGGAPDGQAVLARAWGVWEDRTAPPTLPVARTGCGILAYDSARSRMVLFGGSTTSGQLQDTWELIPSGWVSLAPTVKPPARWGHVLAYDSGRGRVFLFGGAAGGLAVGDCWEWDGANWTDVTPSGARPSARNAHALAYDSGRGRTVLFGGSPTADTWEWDGRAWADRTPAGASPSPRLWPAMAYDGRRGKTVLFSGVAASDGTYSTYLNDTWEWDGSTWTSVARTGPSPSPRRNHAAAFDARRGRIVVFGGYDGAYRGDLWEWDGSTWTSVTAPAGPSARQAHGMAYDTVRGRTVVFGGYNGVALTDVWEWDGSTWTSVSPTGTNPTSGGTLTFDAIRQRAVLFTGQLYGAAETWEWDGRRWLVRTPASGNPPQRSAQGIAYEPSRTRTLLFSGANSSSRFSDTWEWDGSAWTSLTPATSPPGRQWFAMAPEPASNVLVFGGYADSGIVGDTWRWTGSTWTPLAPARSPSARAGAAMVYDSLRGRDVLFGGELTSGLFSSETWEWAPSSWTSTSPVKSPNPRYYHAMAFDSDRGKTFLFGGYARSATGGVLGNVQDAWEWDGSAWTDVSSSGVVPAARSMHSMTYDAARHRVVLFGGGMVGDTWEWNAEGAIQPAVQFDAVGWSAGSNGASPTGVRVRAYGGGTFSPGGAANVGATLFGWMNHTAASGPGAWVPLAANASGIAPQQPYVGAPFTTLVDWTAAGGEAPWFVAAREGRLSFQLRPSGTMGTNLGGAQVALDYVEVRVRYRNP